MKKMMATALLALTSSQLFAASWFEEYSSSRYDDFKDYPITQKYQEHFLEAKRKLIDQGYDSGLRPLLEEMALPGETVENVYSYLVDYMGALETNINKLKRFARRSGDYSNEIDATYVDRGFGPNYYISPNHFDDDALRGAVTVDGWVFLNHLSDAFKSSMCFIESGSDLLDVSEPYWVSWEHKYEKMMGTRGIKDGVLCDHAFLYRESPQGFTFSRLDVKELNNSWHRHINTPDERRSRLAGQSGSSATVNSSVNNTFDGVYQN